MFLKQKQGNLEIITRGEGFTNITSLINSWILEQQILEGVIFITALHTSCSLTINENADKRVLDDLTNYFNAIVPEKEFYGLTNNNNKIQYKHSEEGLDDMPAHIKTALTTTTLSLSIKNRKLVLGTWQAIYLWEHRYASNNRNIYLHTIGEIDS